MRIFFTLLLITGLSTSQAALKGDPEAIAMANQIVKSIGGARLWSQIRTLHVFERSRSPRGDGTIGEFWRDLQQPRERYTLRTRSGSEVLMDWNSERAIHTVDGKAHPNSPENLHELVMDYWPGEIYVMYHRFARGDETLRLVKHEDRSFTAFDDQRERRLGTFWVNEDGELYRWRHDDGTEYIYGPHRQFGAISFPDWGTQVDGSWSFYYVDVRWSGEAFP